MEATAIAKRDPQLLAQAFNQAYSLSDLQRLGDVFVKSGFFSDARDAAQAIVKVMAGQEIGFPPIASMTGVYIVKGKVSLSANLIAAAIKRSGRYTYRVKQLDDEGCSIDFLEGREIIGNSSFNKTDAVKAGLLSENYKKFPRNMFFARALSNGAKWFCPDVFGGPIYTPDELGATVDGETGEVIDVQPEKPSASGQSGTQTRNSGSLKAVPKGPNRQAFDDLLARLKAHGVTVDEVQSEIAQLADGANYRTIADSADAEMTFGGLLPHFTAWADSLDATTEETGREA